MDDLADVSDILNSPTTQFGRVVVLTSVSLVCKLTLNFMNRTTIHNAPAIRYMESREDGRALITVSNHTSTLDDPCIPCALLPTDFFLQEAHHNGNRWVFCAKDVCFKNTLLKMFFQSGKVLPIERGSGLDQPALRVAAERLGKHGDWLHVFPEGRITYDGKLADLRWGVGRMVCESMRHGDGRPPILLPYYHSGMGSVMPYRARVPRVGHNITITLGDPVDIDDVACNCNKKGYDQREVWREITQRVHSSLAALEMRSVANVDQTKSGWAPARHVRGHGGRELCKPDGTPVPQDQAATNATSEPGTAR